MTNTNQGYPELGGLGGPPNCTFYVSQIAYPKKMPKSSFFCLLALSKAKANKTSIGGKALLLCLSLLFSLVCVCQNHQIKHRTTDYAVIVSLNVCLPCLFTRANRVSELIYLTDSNRVAAFIHATPQTTLIISVALAFFFHLIIHIDNMVD